jgi:hypothetical protein
VTSLKTLEGRLLPNQPVTSWKMMAPWRNHIVSVNSHIARLISCELNSICDSIAASNNSLGTTALQESLRCLDSTVAEVRNVRTSFIKRPAFASLKQALIRAKKLKAMSRLNHLSQTKSS